ncbi:MAG: tyrosine--tRNA ligase [Candidatus Campbellbacteria bacterium]|nr:tyrosine--tRNA ligase [Candidatus Campbellbacteria bacterium]
MWFKKTKAKSISSEKIKEILSRGVEEVIDKKFIESSLKDGKKLRIKLGIDPTSDSLHLGSLVLLMKLRDFEEAGHTPVVIIGDFTARIGDTSDKDSERPSLEKKLVEKNMKNYATQIKRILKSSEVEILYNSNWLNNLKYEEVISHAGMFSVSDFIARDNIARRLKAGNRVSLKEVLYPLMQGYDSLVVNADVELGGTDQRFNIIAGRTIQKNNNKKPQSVVLTPILSGLDGKKMSKSFGNTISLDSSPQEIYGGIMSVNDEYVFEYFKLLTRLQQNVIDRLKSRTPLEAKKSLAKEVVSILHGDEEAEKSEKYFEDVFQEKKNISDYAEDIEVSSGKNLVEIAETLNLSRAEMKRLVRSGAIKTERGDSIKDEIYTPKDNEIILIGKRRIVRVKYK